MRKIGNIKGIPLVEGDENLIKNELLYKESGGGIDIKKRDKNNNLVSITGYSESNSSSSDVLYYKLLDITNLGSMVEFIIFTFKTFIIKSIKLLDYGVINKAERFNDSEDYDETFYMIEVSINNKTLKGFSMLTDEVRIIDLSLVNGFIEYPKGDFYHKLTYFLNLQDFSVTEEQVKEAFKDYIIPISKEEYESL